MGWSYGGSRPLRPCRQLRSAVAERVLVDLIQLPRPFDVAPSDPKVAAAGSLCAPKRGEQRHLATLSTKSPVWGSCRREIDVDPVAAAARAVQHGPTQLAAPFNDPKGFSELVGNVVHGRHRRDAEFASGLPQLTPP